MQTYTFTVIVDRPIDEATADELYEAGLDDAAIGEFDGEPAIEFDREAATLLEAIVSAVNQVRSVGGIRAVRIIGEELVSQADIAERTGKSRQAVNNWIKRDRGASAFPSPAFGAATRSPLWRWSAVEAWLEPTATPSERDRVVSLVNATLIARHTINGRHELKLVGALLAAS
jgi:predicted DNA-binding transcriptional regulator AlpA